MPDRGEPSHHGHQARRWTQLLLFAMVSSTNGVIFTSLASVAQIAKGYYNTDNLKINLVGQAVYIGYVVCLPVFSIIYTYCSSLRFCICIAATCDALGAFIRLSPDIDAVVFGTWLTGVALPFFLGMLFGPLLIISTFSWLC